jgi:hypothetical protein
MHRHTHDVLKSEGVDTGHAHIVKRCGPGVSGGKKAERPIIEAFIGVSELEL